MGEYRGYDFPVGVVDKGQVGDVLLSGQPLKKVQEFKYLGSAFQSNGDIAADVNHKIKAG